MCCDPAVRPEVEQRVDVSVERIDRRQPHQLVKNDVRMQRSDEKQSRRLRIGDADRSRLASTAEVVDEDRDAASRWIARVVGSEGQDESRMRSLVHLHHDA